ncbi:MAG: hypothetical protein ACLU4N_25360 [Butyricimonas faecihominis]
MKTKFPEDERDGTYRITIFMLFTLIVERKLHKASPGNEQAFHVRKSTNDTKKTVVIRGIVKDKRNPST